MTRVPSRLADLARLAAKKNTNFAVSGVHLVEWGDGTLTASAGDSKVMLVIDTATTSGEPFEPAEAIVPPASWSKAFRSASALTRASHPEEREVGVDIRDGQVRFESASPGREIVETTCTMAGRYPPVDQIVRRSEESLLEVVVDPKRLAVLLASLASAVGPDTFAVLEFHGSGKPLQVRAVGEDLRATGLADALRTGRRPEGEGGPLSRRVGTAPNGGRGTEGEPARGRRRARLPAQGSAFVRNAASCGMTGNRLPDAKALVFRAGRADEYCPRILRATEREDEP